MPKHLLDAALVAQAERMRGHRSAFDLLSKKDTALAGDAKASWYRMARSSAKDEADIYIFSEIGYWGITAADFSADLREIEAATINLHINSPGGSVFDGLAIYSALVKHGAQIIVHIEGWAASISSVISMAGDEIRIGESAQIMIHSPWSVVIGSAADMRKEADVLDAIEDGIIDIYAARTGGDRNKLADQVKAETWFKGQDAIDAGFADTLVKNKSKAKAAASLKSDFFALIFPNMPEELRQTLTCELAANAGDAKFDWENSTPRDFEQFLRSAGASGQRARRITNDGFKPAKEPPGGAKPADQPADTDRPGDAVRTAVDAAAIMFAAQTFPRI